jgi:uncharacterized protein Yka (UPF0111/DUF47 family)
MMIEASVAIFGVTTIIAVVGSHVRVETRLNESMKQIGEIRRAIGMSNGAEAKFVTVRECGMKEDEIHRELSRIEEKIDDLGRTITEGERA